MSLYEEMPWQKNNKEIKETIFKQNRIREEDSRGQGKEDQLKVERKK
jgi:hypothetical protein